VQEPHLLFFFFQCCCCPLRPPGHCSISDSAFVLSLFIDPLPQSHSMIFGPIFLPLLQSPCLDLLLEPMNPVPSLQNQSLFLEPHFCNPTPELTRGSYREVSRAAICNQRGGGEGNAQAHTDTSNTMIKKRQNGRKGSGLLRSSSRSAGEGRKPRVHHRFLIIFLHLWLHALDPRNSNFSAANLQHCKVEKKA
jgi:hypothetical protein